MSDGARQRLIQVGLATWVGVFVAFLGTTITTFHEPMRIAAIVAYGAPVVLAALYCLVWRPAPLDRFVIAAVALSLLVAWLSSDRIASLETVALVVSFASVFLVASRMTSPRLRAAVAVGVCLAASIWLLALGTVWVVDLVEWVALEGGRPPHIAPSAHMWLGTDIVAVLLMMSVPFYPWIGWRALRRTLAAATTVAAIVVLPLSDARTTWVAIGCGLVVLVAVSPTMRVRVWPRFRVALLVAGSVVTAAAIAAIVSGALGSLSGRTHIWETAVSAFRSSPIVGTGPGTFSWMRLAEAPPLLERYPVYHAHNFVLQTLADGGVVLLAAAALVTLAWLRVVVPVISQLGFATRLAVAALVALALVLMLDDPIQLAAIAAMALILAGWTASDAVGKGTHATAPRTAPWLLGLMLGGTVLLALPSVFAASDARTSASAGRASAIEGMWEAAYAAFAHANTRWPSRAAYELSRGLAAAHLGLVDEARERYEAASLLSPGDPRSYGGLATLTDDIDDRVALLKRASELGSNDPQYSYRLAAALSLARREDEAVRELARAAMIDPQILALLSDDSSQEALEQVLEALPDVLEAEGSLAAVDVESVIAQADVVRGRIDVEHPPALVALAEARLGDLQAAQESIERAMGEAPFEMRTYSAAIAVAEARCERAEEQRLRRLAAIVPGGFTSLYRIGAEVRESRDHIYREMGLGDYQPPGTMRPGVSPYDWPRSFLAGIGCVASDSS